MTKSKTIQLDTTKLMTNEELVMLKGGDRPPDSYLICRLASGGSCAFLYWGLCEYAWDYCNANCPGWETSVCVGP